MRKEIEVILVALTVLIVGANYMSSQTANNCLVVRSDGGHSRVFSEVIGKKETVTPETCRTGLPADVEVRSQANLQTRMRTLLAMPVPKTETLSAPSDMRDCRAWVTTHEGNSTCIEFREKDSANK